MNCQEIKTSIEQVLLQRLAQMKTILVNELNKLIDHNIETKLNEMKSTIVTHIEETVKENNNTLKEICNVKEVNVNQTNVMSYAQSVKSNQNKIVIKPKDKNIKNKEAKNALKRIIEPTEGLVEAVKEINSGGLLVSCRDSEAREKVEQKITESIADLGMSPTQYSNVSH